MSVIWAEHALTPEGWARDVRLEIDAEGRIATLTTGAAPEGQRVGTLLPAPANSHSHAFQRAMAGLSERRGPDPRDSFWTWRKLMYKFLDQITPDQVEAIAGLVQMEMLEAGFATNIEFHYLHHRPDGQPYDKLSEMADRIAAAQGQTGIGLTLLPVQYQFGGCDQRPLGAGQCRFGNTPDQYRRLLEEAGKTLESLPKDSCLGVAPHSLRAVAQEDLRAAASLLPGGPVHMHLAEQIPEVEEVEASWGARPVNWALDNLEMSDRWCLIHLTQMTPEETARLAKTGAVAGLCPITEASLGDGIFDGVRWLENGGAISVGSDSNILISLHEELRSLDTSQRLRDHSRAALATADLSTGRRLFEGVAKGGAQAAGRDAGRLEAGAWADLLALDMTHIDLEGIEGDLILDTFAFAGRDNMVSDVWAAGRHMVREGRHIHRERIIEGYRKAVKGLRGNL